jgi:predicted transcriptional regulator
MVLGAQTPERAMTLEDLVTKLGIDRTTAQKEVDGLISAGYAQSRWESGTSRFYLTGTGIITASSTYS